MICDILIENTDPELVAFEMDIAWAYRAGTGQVCQVFLGVFGLNVRAYDLHTDGTKEVFQPLGSIAPMQAVEYFNAVTIIMAWVYASWWMIRRPKAPPGNLGGTAPPPADENILLSPQGG